MRIAVFGTGGVGGNFGGQLARTGEDVVFIARGEHLQAMRTKGLCIDDNEDGFVVYPIQAMDDPQQVGVVDAILVGVKAWQVEEAALAMRSMVGEDTFVVPLQNGMERWYAWARRLVYLLLCTSAFIIVYCRLRSEHEERLNFLLEECAGEQPDISL